MPNPDPATLAACVIGAVAVVWMSTTAFLQFLGKRPWRNALQRGMVVSVVSLAVLLITRHFMPDLIALVIVFLLCTLADMGMRFRESAPLHDSEISIAVALVAVGVLWLVDGILRVAGYSQAAPL